MPKPKLPQPCKVCGEIVTRDQPYIRVDDTPTSEVYFVHDECSEQEGAMS